MSTHSHIYIYIHTPRKSFSCHSSRESEYKKNASAATVAAAVCYALFAVAAAAAAQVIQYERHDVDFFLHPRRIRDSKVNIRVQ